MTKRLSKQINSFKYKGEPIKITIGTLVLTAFCILLLIVATFTQLTLKHPIFVTDVMGYSGGVGLHTSMTSYMYIPQIPMIFFIVALIGRKFGLLAIISYIILGMFFPIFALGGGISYLFEYGFGYILAYIPAIFLAGALMREKNNFWRTILIALTGVFSIHVLGVLYMLFLAVLRHAPMDLVMSWISSQSGVQILYDIVFSILAIYCGRFFRKFLWIVMC